MEIVYVSICGFFIISSLMHSIKNKFLKYVLHKEPENLLPMLTNYVSFSYLYKYLRLFLFGYVTLFIGLIFLYSSTVLKFAFIDKIALGCIIFYTVFFSLITLLVYFNKKSIILNLLIEADKTDEQTMIEEYLQKDATDEELYTLGLKIGYLLGEKEAEKTTEVNKDNTYVINLKKFIDDKFEEFHIKINFEADDINVKTVLFSLTNRISNLNYKDGLQIGYEYSYRRELYSHRKVNKISVFFSILMYVFYLALFFSCMLLLYHLLFPNVQF